jgi:alpha-L-fucosidase
MVDVPLRGAKGVHNWFWKPGQDHAAYPTEALVRMYYRSVGRNCNLILGEVVTPKGLVPESDIARLAELGKAIRKRFGSPLAETRGAGATVELALEQPGTIDHVVIQEGIEHGERIQAYRVEGQVSGGGWQKLCEGQSVGHKRIQQFAPVEVARVRLVVSEHVAEPRIRSLAVYSAG